MDVQGKVAIITGSGRGVGKDIALEMARLGAKVIVNDIDEEVINEVVSEIKDAGGEAVGAVGSVDSTEDANKIVEIAVSTFDTVDVLVNNAAVIRPAMIDKMTDEQWDLVVDVGLKGPFNMIRAVTPIFKEKSKINDSVMSNGKIINITSVAGLTGTIGQINYGAMKSGVIGLTMSAARELGRYNVQSNAVAFGIVETRMTETIRGERFADVYKSKIVLNRFARTSDVVPSIVFLSSNESDYITGNILNVSGGYHIGV